MPPEITDGNVCDCTSTQEACDRAQRSAATLEQAVDSTASALVNCSYSARSKASRGCSIFHK